MSDDRYKNIYRIPSNRHSVWDYSDPGWYFVTICVKEMVCCLSEIETGHAPSVRLSKYGDVVDRCWREIPHHYPHVTLDEYVVMPNHFHGIVVICEDATVVETGHAPSLRTSEQRPTLGNIIGSFKSASTREIHKHIDGAFCWQPRFYDRVIRNEFELQKIRQYINDNPLRWDVTGG